MNNFVNSLREKATPPIWRSQNDHERLLEEAALHIENLTSVLDIYQSDLYAAAPDMLNALEEVSTMHERYVHRVGASDNWARDVFKKVKAAKEKAKGIE